MYSASLSWRLVVVVIAACLREWWHTPNSTTHKRIRYPHVTPRAVRRLVLELHSIHLVSGSNLTTSTFVKACATHIIWWFSCMELPHRTSCRAKLGFNVWSYLLCHRFVTFMFYMFSTLNNKCMTHSSMIWLDNVIPSLASLETWPYTHVVFMKLLIWRFKRIYSSMRWLSSFRTERTVFFTCHARNGLSQGGQLVLYSTEISLDHVKYSSWTEPKACLF